MTIDQIRSLYQAVPFRPFVMHLADGREIPVVHRDFIIASPNGREVIVYQPDNSFNIVDTASCDRFGNEGRTDSTVPTDLEPLNSE